ncbi:type III-A CRISPR-associated RAMP protein Csm5 [Gordonia sp. (in: high G+C Gram-positive bacteria)]|jgi:CRISPR type III-A-associated RAMP protein Csm5|uniref:type III-A CRISPR-associated RAMP protein Csm5 n=1 Tax=Gordonia sp. (in: high G+C Gram-positive bacteria) TaxID=84139 RepID=UPI001DE84E8E|nr:type III-A CRISPR-associated RAMP protein Csm5 [Gordonia sp. (in: high G+C Gram-positive bacteria)]MCB1293429.1 type III-A CRISPR-associated RAMP protein Csm5 [Gordonia sp. (in: high G+C Gram-positive bacteria)]HMS74761.1 type III-A CRISPR-associated RAMP protein Csm5 [Gordonia sp. (in: high G+C Gram-positive bacteria)]HQV17153.1 type III-A CRISPR-associated RAMP protein Csm5 [Gordonia sp. (in: high G+C Gram-positive bacteria)]
MTTYLRQFDLTFTCVGPVFIGSGQKYSSKEYAVVEGKSRWAYFPDMEKLYALVVSRGLAASFEQFVLNTGGQGQRGTRLGDWLTRNGIKNTPGSHGGYAVEIGPLQKSKPQRGRDGSVPAMNDIHEFIKDGFGNPYVPGSSVKGLLRSLVLQHQLHRVVSGRPNPRPDERTEMARLRRANRPGPKPDDAVNDLLQAIRVSDSPSLPLASLQIVQKVDRPLEGADSGMPLYREALKPATAFTVRVVVDTSVEQHGGWPDGAQFLTDIEQVAAGVNKARYADYAAKYMGGDPFDGPYVYLGGGAGYRSKTIVTDQNQMAAILDKQFNRGSRPVPHKAKTQQLDVSPLALKVAKTGDNEYEEMGLCEISVKEVTE